MLDLFILDTLLFNLILFVFFNLHYLISIIPKMKINPYSEEKIE